MKQIILLFLLVIFHLLTYAQPTGDPRLTNPLGDTSRPSFWESSKFTTDNHKRSIELSPCKPVRGIDYSENIRQPIQPFIFQKLHFETSYGFYIRIALDIEASGKTVVNVQDDYSATTTTVRSDIDRNDFTNLLFILARCDFDSCQEKPVMDDLKCCNSFFEISYNNQIKKAKGCDFSPFDNRELEQALWSYIAFKASHALAAPQIEY